MLDIKIKYVLAFVDIYVIFYIKNFDIKIKPKSDTPLRPLGEMAPTGAFRGFRQIRRNKGGIRYLGASEPRENYRF